MLDFPIPTDDNKRIAAQNDAFRRALGPVVWCGKQIKGQAVMTCGVAAKGNAFLAAALMAVRDFETFTEDNDPYGQHDFGAFAVKHDGREERLFWKIDLYDTEYKFGSESPASLRETRRVLTILLTSEY
ncbi:DUF3768 domain-containing protein [Thioclava sp. BHET1]|nr:DUF3768 domain-containing protein [Thioclava sp. BHET1]